MEQNALRDLARRAKEAALLMNKATSAAKQNMLEGLARLLEENAAAIFEANRRDRAKAEAQGMDAPRLDRLTMTESGMADMRAACLHVAGLPDPIGAMDEQWVRPNGMLVGRMRVPLGVIAMIYESRPNVTIDAAILCLKAGNSVILRGGREALESNIVLAGCLKKALSCAGLPSDAVQFVEAKGHQDVVELCHLDEFIDVMIPRGGESLVRAVTSEARMPVLKHFKGVCHAYIDESADCAMALDIVYNGKVQRPGVCNALECLLVHASLAASFLPRVAEKLATVRFEACPIALPYLGERARPAGPESWGHEFHDTVLAVKVVQSFDEALAHIARYSSQHTDIIVTRDLENSSRFVREVDSSMVGVNVSTRFNDGGQLGLGAEIGISTSKLHAFGPMGVRELTTTKFVVMGSGQVRGA
ncbi:MAG: glutamate-5-semialdehyde dehydrogenase [Desulfovibrionaceae bacterium]|nr:glutamate-5-semialdehyde dehydrogenase [Desulfovibrionaceae bacterium]